MPNTKIVATLGPATDLDGRLTKLLESGVDVFRLNASHGTHEDHGRRIAQARQAAAALGIHAGILLDLQGPKIRLGKFDGGGCTLETGSRFIITTSDVVGDCARASTTYENFARDLKPGDPVLLADGSVRLRVIETDEASVITEVVSGGPISDRKGINLPGVKVSTPSMTKKDMQDLQFGLDQGIDFVALSFVRKAHDVLRLRLFLEEKDRHLPIVAKIEKPEALDNLNAILEESDGVMVARGDLGVEMALERVPYFQKEIIQRARKYGKFVITATQMLESMIDNPVPTRAEVSDVANAIYDGTDAVMLSAETSTGKYPIEAASMMDRVAQEIERFINARGFKNPPSRDNPTLVEIIADSAYQAARAAKAAAIVVFTSTGYSARLVARYRPPVPVFAFTQSEAVARQLSIIYGVQPIIAPLVPSTDAMLTQLEETLVRARLVNPRDVIVFVAGQPIGRPGSTNIIKLHRISESR